MAAPANAKTERSVLQRREKGRRRENDVEANDGRATEYWMGRLALVTCMALVRGLLLHIDRQYDPWS
jgi:hypothetical protein